jgi:hypothetical protein
MRERTLLHFLWLVSLINGRTGLQVRRIIGMPRSTFVRYLSIARRAGMVIVCHHYTHIYEVRDSGPFDLARLARSVFRMPGGVRAQPRPPAEVRG